MRWTTLLLLATVMITISQPPQVVSCPMPAPQVMKNADGTYYRSTIIMIHPVTCFSDGKVWQEEWTDYPEKGGAFIQRITPEKDAR